VTSRCSRHDVYPPQREREKMKMRKKGGRRMKEVKSKSGG
jgi:hypothetical protein